MPEVVGEYVDRLCTVEMRPSKGNLPRDFVRRLYDAAREQAGVPLSSRMAKALMGRVDEGDAVFIVTGAGGPPVLPNAETDGLLGAAALAKAIHLGVGGRPVVLTEDRAEGPVRAACRAAGLNFVGSGESMQHAVTFEPTPIDDEECRRQASELLDVYQPAAIIAIEKISPNREGVLHGSTGVACTDIHSKPQHLFREARRRGIFTGGIGDGGNEVGFGGIRDAVREIMPAGADCGCPCGGGTASDVAVDALVVAAVSNWGAYGVAAMIGYLLERPDAVVDTTELEWMMRACVGAGALDGALARPTLTDDGIPLEAHLAHLTMLRSITSIANSTVLGPGH